MWILHLLPDSFILFIVYAVLAAGGVLTGLSYLIKWIPGISAYKLPMRIGGILLLICGVYFYGGYSTEMQWRERVAEMEAKVAESQVKSTKTNTKIKKVFVDRVKVVKQDVIVVQEKIKEVEKLIDKDCRVPPEAVNLLNQAAKPRKATVEVGPLEKDDKQ
jgi:ribosomal protein L24